MCIRDSAISDFEYCGYVEHASAVKLMFKADILLNFLFDNQKRSSMISGKLIEYMATGNPILMIGDSKSEAAKLLSNQSYNLTVDPGQIKKINSFIKNKYENWIEGKINKPEYKPILPFSREQTTKSLIKVLENI